MVFCIAAHLVSCAVAMFYLAVVLGKGQVADRGFDAQDAAKLVVELERNRPDGV